MDLQIALASLEGINGVVPESSLVRQGLWRSAVEHCMKCFSASEARSRLDPPRKSSRETPKLTKSLNINIKGGGCTHTVQSCHGRSRRADGLRPVTAGQG